VIALGVDAAFIAESFQDVHAKRIAPSTESTNDVELMSYFQHGDVAIITGAAAQGIRKAVARRFAAEAAGIDT